MHRDIYRRVTGFGAEIQTIALVQGKALGGALNARRGRHHRGRGCATFSLPEVLFNLFPGMGALSFLARRVGMRKAEEIIASGRVYTASEMYDIGVVDEIAEDGLGYETVRALICAGSVVTTRFVQLDSRSANSSPLSCAS